MNADAQIILVPVSVAGKPELCRPIQYNVLEQVTATDRLTFRRGGILHKNKFFSSCAASKTSGRLFLDIAFSWVL